MKKQNSFKNLLVGCYLLFDMTPIFSQKTLDPENHAARIDSFVTVLAIRGSTWI
jgi:hypothetical protein